MQITFTIPDNYINELQDAFVYIYPDKPAAMTAAQWSKEKIKAFVKTTYARYKTHQAEQSVSIPADLMD